MMLANYFKIAIRNIRRQKVYTIINIAGLAIGMASSILILLFVYDELACDRFHPNADNIYRVYAIIEESGEKLPVALTPKTVAGALEKDFQSGKSDWRKTACQRRRRPNGNRHHKRRKEFAVSLQGDTAVSLIQRSGR
jgi:hypothetical protein